MEKVFPRPSLPADFWDALRASQHLWWRSAWRERSARDQLVYLVPHKCVESYLFRNFARVARHISLPLKRPSIEESMGCAALPLLCVSCFGSRLWNDANNGLWVQVYIGWPASCAGHLEWDAYEFQQLWYISLLPCAMVRALDLSVLLGGHANYDEPTYLILIVGSIEWSMRPIANNRRPKGR